MPTTLESLGIDRMSVAERLDLIEQIWDSLPVSLAPSEVPAWHLDILAQRLADAEAHPGVGQPAREALDAIEATL